VRHRKAVYNDLESGPVNKKEKKCSKKMQVIWENGPVNRSLKTSFEMMIVDDGWFNGVRQGVSTAPKLEVRVRYIHT
jgi:hypothetical protein